MVRAALAGEVAEGVDMEVAQWRELFLLLQESHVAALCAEAAGKAGAPREVLIPWIAERAKSVEWHRHQHEVQQEIVSVMASHGIETLVLKGTHLATYYPEPQTREFGDLDLYFYDKHDEADRVASEVLKVKVSNDGHHHSKYDYRGVTVESHYDFVNVHYPWSNRRYEAMLKEWVPSATFEVLFLLRHMAGHFASSRIGLRDLIDWTLTGRALAKTVDWGVVRQAAVDYGMAPFAAALEEISARRLQGERRLELQGDPQLTERLERDIVSASAASRDDGSDGLGRIGWKLRRWRSNRWKRSMALGDADGYLLLASLVAHTKKPHSIMHKV